jgi:hypothetical protein
MFLIVPLLILALNPSIAANSPKSGQICSKQGLSKTYKNMKYTCIKSGKKLIWSKGVLVRQATANTTESSKPAPTPISTPSPETKEVFTPWSTKFTTQVMSDKAFESFATWSKEQVGRPKNHQVLVQTYPASFDSSLIQELKALDDFTSGIFSQFMKSKSVTVLGFDEEWVISQINGTGGHLRNMQGRCNEPTGPYYVCINRESHFGIVIVENCKMPKNSVSSCQLGVHPHEYFHLIQINTADNIQGPFWDYGDENSKNAFPHWLVEGSAEFVASATTAMFKNAKYEDLRLVTLLGGPSMSMSYALIDYEFYRVNSAIRDNLHSYNIGHVATEYIVASIGFQKFMDIWKDYAITRNFDTSFEKVTGRSIATFYADFERARESLGIPPVTRKR